MVQNTYGLLGQDFTVSAKTYLSQSRLFCLRQKISKTSHLQNLNKIFIGQSKLFSQKPVGQRLFDRGFLSHDFSVDILSIKTCQPITYQSRLLSR